MAFPSVLSVPYAAKEILPKFEQAINRTDDS